MLIGWLPGRLESGVEVFGVWGVIVVTETNGMDGCLWLCFVSRGFFFFPLSDSFIYPSCIGGPVIRLEYIEKKVHFADNHRC